MAKGLKLDSTTHDLVYTDGELEVVHNADEITRNIKTRLQLSKGEYFLDSEYGFPYNSLLGARIFDLKELETTVKLFILETEGVIELTQFSLDFEKGDSRKLYINFTVLTIYGRVIVNESLSLN